MKKLMILSVAAATMLMSCNGVSTGNGSANDSISATYGEMVGTFMYRNIAQNPDPTMKIDKKDFMKGVQKAMGIDTARVSYSIGMQVGMQMMNEIKQLEKQQNVKINPDAAYKAMTKVMMSDSLSTDPMIIQQRFQKALQDAQREAKMNDPRAIENDRAGKAFIEKAMKEDPSIKKTESGLAYKVINEGAAEKFKATDRIKVIYKGTKIDGSEFDSSKGEPVVFSPSMVVKGFGEALQMMGAGSKMIIYIPGELAYGVDGQGLIEPNETLIFEVETVGLEESK